MKKDVGKIIRVSIILSVFLLFFLWGYNTGTQKGYYFEKGDLYTSEGALEMPRCILEPGEYSISIGYTSKADAEISVYTNEVYNSTFIVPSSPETESEYIFNVSIDKTYGEFRILVVNSEDADIAFNSVFIDCSKSMNNDRIFIAALGLLVSAFVWWTIREKDLTGLTSCGVILAALIISNIPVFKPHLISVLYQDLEFHLTRMEGIRAGIIEKQIPVQILPQSFSGFGMLGSMYPGIFLYIPAALRVLFNISTVVAWQLMDVVINSATAFCMYLSAKVILQDGAKKIDARYISTILTVIYLLAPYRLNNVYIRAAFGEACAMIFIPLVIAGLYKALAAKEPGKWGILAVGMSGIIASHVISSVFIVIICVLYVLAYLKSLKQPNIVKGLLKSGFMTILFSAWFIAPFAYYSITERLDLSALDRVFTDQSLGFSDLLKNYITYDTNNIIKTHYSIGLIGLIVMIVGLVLLTGCIKSRRDFFGGYTFVIGFLSAGLSLRIFPWDALQKINLIDIFVSKVQFPWRFLSLSTSLMIMGVGSMFYENLDDIRNLGDKLFKSQKIKMMMSYIAAGLLVSVMLFSVIPFMHTYMNHDRIIRKSDGGGTCIGAPEYLPEIEGGYDTFITAPSYAICSNYDIIFAQNYTKNGTKISFEYSCSSDNEYVDVPLTYYSDYEAYENDENGNRRILETSMSEYGTVRVHLTKHEEVLPLLIHFKINPLVWTSFIISFCSILTYIVIEFKRFVGTNRRKRE